MDEVYDLHRHTHCVAFRIRENVIDRDIYSTSTRCKTGGGFSTEEDGSYITYDKQNSKVLSWGRKYDNEDENTMQIDMSGERLYRLFAKDKDSWDQDDLFFFKAVSDFIGLSVEKLMEEHKNAKKIKDTSALHYVFVAPSVWEEEIREVLIRPLFVQANLISKDDHQDRLLFCTDVESTYYYITQYQGNDNLKLKRNTIIRSIDVVEESKVSIQLYSIFIGNPLFDFSNSLLFPKLLDSNSSFLTTNDVKNGIREFIKTKFSFDVSEETSQNLMEEIIPISYENIADDDESLSETDKYQKACLQSISPFDICAEISKHLSNNLKLLLQNNLIKEYSILKMPNKCWRGPQLKVDRGLLDWAEFLFDYTYTSFGSKYIVSKRLPFMDFDYAEVLEGAVRYSFDAIQNSDIYSKPRILSTEHSATSSSIFLKSKPDAIMNIDISLESTMLSFSPLDKNGLVKEIWNHKYFVPDSQFVIFVERYFTENTDDGYDSLNEDIMTEIEGILNVEGHNKDSLVSTQQQLYIREFLRIYMIYINAIVSSKLSAITASDANIKIGYAITIDSMLLKRLFGTEDNLRDIVYASNLVQKDDGSKKLRVTTHGEGLFPAIQQSFNLHFPLKSFFVVAQLYEDHVQLTLNQVVTESSLENEYQEAIIIQEEMIPIPNIYKSLCFNMWNIIEESSLVQLCNIHEGLDDNELLEILTLENQAEFTNNLKEYISKNILNESLDKQKTDATTIYLSTSCNCRVCLTVNDITEVSFRPVLQDIISLVSASRVNEQLFGKYRNIQYLFHLIRFNNNTQFQRILTSILEDETDHFLYEQGIGMAHYTIPKLSNQLLRPILQQESRSYKAFQAGVLHHVYSENYGFSVDTYSDIISYNIKDKISDSKIVSADNRTVFSLFRKDNKINNSQTDRVFYFSSEESLCFNTIRIKYFKLKSTEALSSDETIHSDDTLESINGPDISRFGFKTGHYAPFLISIVYEGHSSSLSLVVKPIGSKIEKENVTSLLEPMTLARF
ncbi:hypothetical protein EDC94DRAFT_689813 [Helicostylum pulchrum]|nr:hypothetical protein EDC94DRAFT_689813 [Helicostylum pulchrum]